MAKLMQCDMCGKIVNTSANYIMHDYDIDGKHYDICTDCSDEILRYMDVKEQQSFDTEYGMPMFVNGVLGDYRKIILDIRDSIAEKIAFKIEDVSKAEFDVYNKIIKSVEELIKE